MTREQLISLYLRGEVIAHQIKNCDESHPYIAFTPNPDAKNGYVQFAGNIANIVGIMSGTLEDFEREVSGRQAPAISITDLHVFLNTPVTKEVRY